MNPTLSGSEAEAYVAEYLTADGYKILARNWKTAYAEIDVIAEKDGVIYLTEVKYRRTDTAGDGFDYITSRKIHHMNRAAEAWVLKAGWKGEYALLAVAVLGEPPKYELDIRELV